MLHWKDPLLALWIYVGTSLTSQDDSCNGVIKTMPLFYVCDTLGTITKGCGFDHVIVAGILTILTFLAWHWQVKVFRWWVSLSKTSVQTATSFAHVKRFGILGHSYNCFSMTLFIYCHTQFSISIACHLICLAHGLEALRAKKQARSVITSL